MKYFIDTEFLEGTQLKRVPFLNFKRKETKPTIDLISIGIVSEDNRTYYAISKDFNLKEAWNRYDLDYGSGDQRNKPPRKHYWIRENVLKSVFNDLELLAYPNEDNDFIPFNYTNFKKLLKQYGKSNKEIAREIRNFIMLEKYNSGGQILLGDFYPNDIPNPEFYGYYADYDWVVFCWLFGKMIDLPKGFPMYCRDLKQMLDEKVHSINMYYLRDIWSNDSTRFLKGDLQEKDRLATFKEKIKAIKEKHPNYPKQLHEHNALEDAKWNKELYNFIINL